MKPHPLASDAPFTECSHAALSDDVGSRLDLARMQRDQYRHDMRNHFDILSLHKHDRLKHYGLHFAKYVGRIARGSSESKPLRRTVIDTLLICLSAANTLHQDLKDAEVNYHPPLGEVDLLRFFADAAGRFADACEKIDHLEDFLAMIKAANCDLIKWVVYVARSESIDISSELRMRRQELARRQFFIEI